MIEEIGKKRESTTKEMAKGLIASKSDAPRTQETEEDKNKNEK